MSLVKRFRGNVLIAKNLRGTTINALRTAFSAVRAKGKWLILAALLGQAAGWFMLLNDDIGFNRPPLVFGRPASEMLAGGIGALSILALGFTALTIFVIGPLVIFDLIFSAKRSKQGCCASCGYNLTGNISGTCPECGSAVSRAK
jgi:hypothetical protein